MRISLHRTVMIAMISANTFLFLSLFGNQVDMVRVASLIVLDGATIFGAALLRFLGGKMISVLLLTAGLTIWVAVPLSFSNACSIGRISEKGWGKVQLGRYDFSKLPKSRCPSRTFFEKNW